MFSLKTTIQKESEEDRTNWEANQQIIKDFRDKLPQKNISANSSNYKEALSFGLIDQIIKEGQEEQVLDELIQQLSAPSYEAQREVKRLTKFIQQNPSLGVITETINTLSNLKQSVIY